MTVLFIQKQQTVFKVLSSEKIHVFVSSFNIFIILFLHELVWKAVLMNLSGTCY